MPKRSWNLVGDVGGTHTRLALCTAAGELEKISSVASSDFTGIDQAIRGYLQSAGNPKIDHAAIGMANPVTGDQVQMTNLPWRFSIKQTRAALGLKSLHIINDFTALALSLPLLPPAELIKVGGQTSIPGTPLGVLGPGTGLGISGLIPARHGDWTPIAGEGGHGSFAPGDDREIALWHEARRQFGHVSMERLLSGAGLEFIYQAFSRLADKPVRPYAAADISRHAIDNTCPRCREALDTFCAVLGTAASDIALTLGARGGIYIGGGIVPRLGDYFLQSPFRARFESKGRFSGYLAAIPVFLITSPYPGLVGAAAYLDAHRNV